MTDEAAKKKKPTVSGELREHVVQAIQDSRDNETATDAARRVLQMTLDIRNKAAKDALATWARKSPATELSEAILAQAEASDRLADSMRSSPLHSTPAPSGPAHRGTSRIREEIEGRKQEERDKRDELMVELSQTTSASTSAMARWMQELAVDQLSQRWLTNVLAFAVLYTLAKDIFEPAQAATKMACAELALGVLLSWPAYLNVRDRIRYRQEVQDSQNVLRSIEEDDSGE